MRKLFDLNSPMMRFLAGVCDWILLNMMTIVFSLPVFTIGAATTAMYYCVDKQRKEEDSLFKDFWHSFKSNFKQATGMWMIFLGIGIVILYSIMCSFWVDTPGFKVLGIISCGVMILLSMVATWSFILLSMFENTVKQILSNALICAMANLPKTFLAGLINILPLAVFFFLPNVFLEAIVYLALIWFTAVANYIMWLFKKPIAKLVDTSIEYMEAQEATEA